MIKAPDPWKDQTSWMSYGVHKHRSPDDDEGVPPYYGQGANWMPSRGPNNVLNSTTALYGGLSKG